MNFGQAIEALKEGKRVQRTDWVGKSKYLILVPAVTNASIKPDTVYGMMNIDRIDIQAHIDMRTGSNTIQPGWIPTQEELLSEDWVLV